MKKKHVVKAGCLAASLLCMSLLAGCSGKGSNGSAENTMNNSTVQNNTAASADSAGQEETDAPADTETAETDETYDLETMEIIKYNIYIEMNNYMVEMLEILDDYYSVVEYADEFALIPDSEYTYKYGVHSLNSSIVEDALSVASME
ncbi:MAG: hypothetical protein K2P39_09805, partial [Lachnospiraceae bacterium]|nr:hypothetical protein [Lachnospiraceae bacterium]